MLSVHQGFVRVPSFHLPLGLKVRLILHSILEDKIKHPENK